ncbi:MAG TPA: MFS transporter [Blastocatellia bacterium]|nr:MFS transporter [Blastocatellia bacterium]
MSQTKAFLTIYVSVAISYLGVGLVAPLIAVVLTEHGENSFVVGLIGTTMFAAFTLASFPIGTLTDRVGPKSILIGGLILYGAAIAMFAMIQVTWLFFIARFIEGIGAAGVSVAVETMINQLSKSNERAQRMSYYALSVGLGWAAGPLTGTLLFGVYHWLPFIACFAFSLLAALLVSGLVPETGSDSHHHEHLAQGLSMKLAVPMSAGAIYGYLMSSLVNLIPIYLQKELQVSQLQMGLIITSVIIGMLASQVPIGRAADRYGKRKTLLFCASCLAVLFYFIPFITSQYWWHFLIAGALAGALAGSLYPIGLAIIGSAVKKEKLGAATSLFSLAFGFGSVVGPSVSGLAMDELSDYWLFYLPAILTAAFSVELIILYKKTAARRRESAHDSLF